MSHRRFRICCTAVLGTLIVLHGAVGNAQSGSKAARPFYDKGVFEYTLGHFPEAIAQFERAYEIDPAPILLFNIAQAHRHSGNGPRAIFFYRRYLDQAPRTATNRSDVEKRIKELEESGQKQAALKPESIAGGWQTPAAPGSVANISRSEGVAASPDSLAHPISVGADVGPSFPSFVGPNDLQPTTLVAIRVFGAYAFGVGRGVVEVGAAGTFTPMHYQNPMEGGGWSTFWGGLARVGGSYPIALDGALHIIADVEGGVIWWSGLAQDNPFSREPASGPVPMPTLRLGAGLRYEFGDRLFAYALPAFTFSKTTSDGLTSTITSVTRIDLPLGLGWKF